MNTEITTYARRFRQHDMNLYMFTMPYNELLQFVEVMPHSEEHPEYPQRPIDERRLREIAGYVSDNRYIPPSIILNLYSSVRMEEVEALEGVGSMVKFTVPGDGRKHAYCLDGQHRLWAFDSEKVAERLNIGDSPFEYSVVAFHNVSFEVLVEQFMTINTTQEKVNRDQITTVAGRHEQLPPPDQRAFRVAELFNTRQGSILQRKIFFMPGDRGTIIRLNRFKQLIKPYLVDQNALLGTETSDEIYRIINSYLRAWSELYPDAWAGTRHYVLLKTAGIETMFTLFEPAYNRCRLFHSSNFTVDTFKEMLGIFKTHPVDLTQPGFPERKEVVDWSSAKYRQFCSGKESIAFFVRAMKKVFKDASPVGK